MRAGSNWTSILFHPPLFAMVALAAFAFIAKSQATTIAVTVVDPSDRPMEKVVVVAKALTAITSPSHIEAPAIMDQLNKEFVPEVLVIRAGSSVLFPNSDSVAHQVYSFSPAKRFALPLYRGRPHPPVLFEQPGVVTLGCNIHDRMVGYIFVADSPYFGQTDEKGRVILRDIPAAKYRISVWSPALIEQPSDQVLSIKNAEDALVNFKLTRAPRTTKKTSDARVRDY